MRTRARERERLQAKYEKAARKHWYRLGQLSRLILP